MVVFLDGRIVECLLVCLSVGLLLTVGLVTELNDCRFVGW